MALGLNGVDVGLDIATLLTVGAGLIGWFIGKSNEKREKREKELLENKQLVWKHLEVLDDLTSDLVDIRNRKKPQDPKILEQIYSQFRKFQFEAIIFATDDVNRVINITHNRLDKGLKYKSVEMTVFALGLLIDGILNDLKDEDTSNNYLSKWNLTPNEALEKYQEFEKHFESK